MEDRQIERLAAQASDALTAGNHARAVALLDQLIAEQPDRADFRFWQSEALLSLDRCEDALAAARRAVELDPGFARAYRPLAWAAGHVGRVQEGQVAFERALIVADRNPRLLAEYAMFLAAFRAPRVALGAAQEAINADPTIAEAWVAMGWAQFRMHEPKRSEASLRRALELEPDNSRALVGMIELLNSTGRPDEAKALVELLRDHPEAAEIAEVLRSKADRHYRFLPPKPQAGAPGPADTEAAPFPWRDFLAEYARVLIGALGAVLIVGGIAVMAGEKLGLASRNDPAFGAGLFIAGAVLVAYLVVTRDR